jgi:hypothetical protein
MKSITRLYLCVLLGAAAVTSVQPAVPEALPDSIKLTYSVRLYETELGNLITELSKNGDTYHAKAETRAEGLAAILLGGTLREKCEFDLSDSLEVRPRQYRIEKDGRNAYSHTAEFLWPDMKVRYDDGRTLDIPPAGYVIDNCTVPFAFVAAGGIKQKDYPYIHILGGKRLRHFEGIKISRERVEVPAGEFETIRFDQQRVGSTDKTLSIWVAPDRHNIAVKIVERRKFRITTMELLESEGLGN